MAASKIETRVLQVLQSTSDREYQTQFLTKNSAFSRIESQKMSFEEMTLFMIANTGKSLSFELLEFFNNAQNIENVITKQAFSKQRQYIQNELFQDLSCGMSILSTKNGENFSTGIYWSLLTALPLKYQIQRNSETILAVRKRLQAMRGLVLTVFMENLDSVMEMYPDFPLCFLFDRGYISLPLLLELEKHKVSYLFRIPASCYKKETSLAKSKDEEISIAITKARLNGVASEEMEVYLSRKSLSVRLVQVELDAGEMEYLLTNLPASEVPYEEMKEFYYQRWEIEKSFNLLKNRLHIENISARTPEGVLQDIQATVFLGNIIEDITYNANQKLPQSEKKKYEYRVNVNLLCGVVKNYFLLFFFSQAMAESRKIFYYQQLLRFLKQTVIANKRGLKNPRIKKVSRNKHKTNIQNNY